MRCPRVVHRLSDPLATFVLAALVMPAALACGILTSDPASSPTTPPSDSSSSEVAGSRKDGEPGTGIEFEPKATPRPTATSLPTATPYPTATAFPTAAPDPTQTAGAAPSVPTTVPTPASAEGAATPGSSPVVVPAVTAVAGTSSPGPSTGPTQFTFSGRTELKHPKVGSTLDDLIARVQAGEISAEEAAGQAPIHRGDSVGVTIHLSGNVDGVVRFLEANGASNISAGDDYIEAYVPILVLPETSEQPGVLRVRVIQPPESPAEPVAGCRQRPRGSRLYGLESSRVHR